MKSERGWGWGDLGSGGLFGDKFVNVNIVCLDV